jgi:2-oxoglutarate ferredoxin oxidoreductase subunit gamma
MKEKIFLAGHGGQGIVLAGSLIANTAMIKGLEVCGTVSYGAEIRGGTANACVIISDEPIGSPIIVHPDIALIFNQMSLDKFLCNLSKDSLAIINTSECNIENIRKDIKVIAIKASDIAREIGNEKTSNLVMIGAYLKNTKTLDKESTLKMIRKVLPKATDAVIETNKKALIAGYDYVY